MVRIGRPRGGLPDRLPLPVNSTGAQRLAGFPGLIHGRLSEKLPCALSRASSPARWRAMTFAAPAQNALAAEAIMLRAGEATGPSAVFTFEKAKPHRIVLRTNQAGIPGSRIEVFVDKAMRPAFRHVFSAGECKFGDSGSKCEEFLQSRSCGDHRPVQARTCGQNQPSTTPE